MCKTDAMPQSNVLGQGTSFIFSFIIKLEITTWYKDINYRKRPHNDSEDNKSNCFQHNPQWKDMMI